MGESEDNMSGYEEKDGIVILSKGNQLNYNLPENQWFAQRVEWPKAWRTCKEPVHIILQWFIYVRNYGVVRYQGKIYNLNLKEEADQVLSILEAERFLVKVEKGVRVIDPDYAYLGFQPIHQLWVNLIDLILPQLSEAEIREYNLEHDPKRRPQS